MADSQQILAEQRSYFLTGQTRPLSARLDPLARLLRLIREQSEPILSALQIDLNRPEAESQRLELGPVIAELQLYLRELKRWSKHTSKVERRGRNLYTQTVTREPKGSILILANWTLPLRSALIPLINAVGAGNCVVLKTAVPTQRTNLVLKRLLEQVFDKRHVSVLMGDDELGRQLTDQPFDHICYIGNAATATEVMAAAARRLTPVTLQLGGKSPCIVTRSADMEQAAQAILDAKRVNHGQNCLAPDYILVEMDAKASFVDALLDILRKEHGLDSPQRPERQLAGPGQVARMQELVRSGRIIWGGRIDPVRQVMDLTLMDQVSFRSPIMRQEIFGPILPILTYRSLPSILERLNRLPHPLTLFLFSQDVADQRLVRDFAIAGSCRINLSEPCYDAADYPHGGVGESGMGALGGEAGFNTFSYDHTTFSMI